MKNLLKIITLGVLLIATTLNAQTPDLILQKEITAQYNAYLDSMETVYSALLPGADDTQTMKAHMGLAVIQAARTYVNGDTLVKDLDYLLNEISLNYENMVHQTIQDIFPIFDADNPDEFVLNLTEFFETGTYPVYRDSIDKWLTENSNFADDMEESIYHFGEKTGPLFDVFGEHLDSLFSGTADFEFNVQIMGSKYEETPFVFSRAFFDHLIMIGELGEIMAETLGQGFTQILDSLNNNSPAIDPGVEIVQEGLDSLNVLIDNVQILLVNQPFAPFELDVAWMDSLQKGIAEIDTMLSGKTYPIGPESENKVIRPRGIIESLAHHDGPMGVFKDYYRGGEDPEYTFSNTFPEGLTAKMYAMIASDITLNANDSREQFETKLHAYQQLLLLKEANQITELDPDEHFGLALTLLYDMLNDEEYFGNIESVIQMISDGRIDSLMDTFTWSDFDLQAQIDEIRYHLDQYTESANPVNYVILVKDNYDELGSYVLGPNSEFSIFFLSTTQVSMAVEAIEMACRVMSMIGDAVNDLYNELDQMFILDLDPTYLDFSDVDGPMDVINILEQSNPDFLTVTPYGVEKFHEMGAWFKDSFNSMGIFLDNLTDLFVAMEPYEADFDMDAEYMQSMMSMMADQTWIIYRDFANPDSTVLIDGERVNLSAWFDNPPTSFLVMVKNFFMGADSTLGGLFPDRFKVGIAQGNDNLPTQFKLYPVYPNPFNPVAKIEFDLPQTSDVKLCIVDLQGRIIEQIVNRRISAGRIAYNWNASRYPSGIYFALLEIDGRQSIRKMTLLK
ncbi:MAG: T9SS type A sorting domain-containing protein [Candidatus Marinimicrobia bacterium]|nr:T9SS type A sorting domain-containing protein [Candidatus Neomarinimicrobiota bacterium]